MTSGPVATAVKATINDMLEVGVIFDHAYRAWLPQSIREAHYENLGTEVVDALLMGGEWYADFWRKKATRIVEDRDA